MDTRECDKSDDGWHKIVSTGRTRPGWIFGNLCPDKEKRCTTCGLTYWGW